jgi:predicted SAM-dependent methyltransferase
VLHLAPEAALARRLRAIPDLRYHTGDAAPGPLVDRVLDARALPFADESVDLVLCSHVLEHISDDVQVAREFARVLTPQGQALVQVPVDTGLAATYEDPSVVTPAGRRAAYGQDDHVRVYAADVIDRLRAGGLDVTRVAYAERLARELRFRYLLDSERGTRPGSDIYRCVA